MHPSHRFADNLAGMICECRWLAIGLALSFTALACSRRRWMSSKQRDSSKRWQQRQRRYQRQKWHLGRIAPSCSGLAATCGHRGTMTAARACWFPVNVLSQLRRVDFTDKSYPATVDDFYLDKYEITVAGSGSS